MGRAIVYTGRRRFNRGRRSSTVRESWYVGPMAFKFVAVAAAAVLLSLYVSNSSQAARDAAVSQKISDEQADLQTQLQALDVEAARYNNAENTRKAAEEMKMNANAPEVQLTPKKQ